MRLPADEETVARNHREHAAAGGAGLAGRSPARGKTPVNTLTAKHFTEFLQPTIERLLKWTFQEHCDRRPAGNRRGWRALFERRHRVHARFPCEFFECPFSE